MTDVKNVVSKLEIIRDMANEASVKQVCDVVIEYIRLQDKKGIGFKK